MSLLIYATNFLRDDASFPELALAGGLLAVGCMLLWWGLKRLWLRAAPAVEPVADKAVEQPVEYRKSA